MSHLQHQSQTPPPPFELYRDTHGIPHVRAATEGALAYGQGYVTALDRADQIESGRHRAEARLATQVGPAGLTWDRFAVRVRLADTARRVTDALAEPEREWLTAYARGVNAGLAAGGGAGIAGGAGGGAAGGRRHTWQAWTPVGMFLVDHVLFNGFPGVLWRDHVARTLGPRFPDVPPETLAEWFAADGGPGAGSESGSNAWAIGADATSTGKPLLAGDPHRILELPGTYQQIRLACTDPADPYDVLGLAFPGVPGVQHFGHAVSDGGRGDGGPDAFGVAWGITNAMAHHVEVFEERFRPAADGGWEALGPDGWEPAKHGRETIEIRDAERLARESVPWIETPRGVWVATRSGAAETGAAETGAAGAGAAESGTAVPRAAGSGAAGPDATGPDAPTVSTAPPREATPQDATPQYTIRWPVRVLADAGVATWRRLLRSRTAHDVATAFAEGWVDPVNRVLTADSTGEVLSLTTGRVAERTADERVLPVQAWTEAARTRDWTRLPEPTRVTSGVAVDANERPITTERAFGNDGSTAASAELDVSIESAALDGRGGSAGPDVGEPSDESEASGALTPPASRQEEAVSGAPGPSRSPRDRRRNREAHALGWSYAPYRADRIRELLAEAPAAGESPSTQRRIHSDVSSGAALALMERTGIPPELRSWAEAGAPMDAESAEAAKFARWRDTLVRRIASDPRLAGLHEDPALYGEIFAPWFVTEAMVGYGLLRVLDALGADPWPTTDEITVTGVASIIATEAAAAGAAPATATTASAASAGTAAATWADLHTLAPVRLPGGPELSFPAAPISGDNDTVRCTGSTPGVSPQASRGSVARWIWDLSDRRNSRWVVPFGASGRPGDPHVADQHATWADGGTIPVETDWDRLDRVNT